MNGQIDLSKRTFSHNFTNFVIFTLSLRRLISLLKFMANSALEFGNYLRFG